MKVNRNGHWPAKYQIEVAGQLGSQWSDWFEGAAISGRSRRTLFISNELDQQGLHGLLVRTRDLGLPGPVARAQGVTLPPDSATLQEQLKESGFSTVRGSDLMPGSLTKLGSSLDYCSMNYKQVKCCR